MVAVSSKLFQDGMRVGKKVEENKKQLKFTFKMQRRLPSCFQIFSDQIYLSEDVAWSKIILENKTEQNNVIFFDRGLRTKKTFEKLSVDHITFITRTHLDVRHTVLLKNVIAEKPNEATVTS